MESFRVSGRSSGANGTLMVMGGIRNASSFCSSALAKEWPVENVAIRGVVRLFRVRNPLYDYIYSTPKMESILN